MLNMTDDERDVWLRELYGDSIRRYDDYRFSGKASECYDVPIIALLSLTCFNDKWSYAEKEQWKHDHYVGDSTNTRWGFGELEELSTNEIDDGEADCPEDGAEKLFIGAAWND